MRDSLMAALLEGYQFDPREMIRDLVAEAAADNATAVWVNPDNLVHHPLILDDAERKRILDRALDGFTPPWQESAP